MVLSSIRLISHDDVLEGMNITPEGVPPSPQFNDGIGKTTSAFEPQLGQYLDPDPLAASPGGDCDPALRTSIGDSSSSSPPRAGDNEGDVANGTGLASPKNKKHVPRGADASRDKIWTRHHAICSLGVIADLALGGYEAARAETQAQKLILPHLKKIALGLLVASPWILDVRYLNFGGAVGLDARGLEKYYLGWAKNRLYYFFYRSHNEHPAYRTKANLKSVYGDFYEAFAEDFAERRFIEEEVAQTFWLSVADRVPFFAPAPAPLDVVSPGTPTFYIAGDKLAGIAQGSESSRVQTSGVQPGVRSLLRQLTAKLSR